MTHYQFAFPLLFIHCNGQTLKLDVTQHHMLRFENMIREWVEFAR